MREGTQTLLKSRICTKGRKQWQWCCLQEWEQHQAWVSTSLKVKHCLQIIQSYKHDKLPAIAIDWLQLISLHDGITIMHILTFCWAPRHILLCVINIAIFPRIFNILNLDFYLFNMTTRSSQHRFSRGSSERRKYSRSDSEKRKRLRLIPTWLEKNPECMKQPHPPNSIYDPGKIISKL